MIYMGDEMFPRSDRDQSLLNDVLSDVKETTPARTLLVAWDTLLNNKALNPERSKRGQWFELLIKNALIQAGVPYRRIRTEKQMFKHLNVEADLMVYPSNPKDLESKTYFLLCKTSLRERWKQWDRDAAAFPYVQGVYNAYAIGLFDREETHQTTDKAIALAAKRSRQCISLRRVITIRDVELMDRMLAHIAGSP